MVCPIFFPFAAVSFFLNNDWPVLLRFPPYLNSSISKHTNTNQRYKGVETTALAELIGQEKGLGTLVHCTDEDDVFALATTLNVRAHLEVRPLGVGLDGGLFAYCPSRDSVDCTHRVYDVSILTPPANANNHRAATRACAPSCPSSEPSAPPRSSPPWRPPSGAATPTSSSTRASSTCPCRSCPCCTSQRRRTARGRRRAT